MLMRAREHGAARRRKQELLLFRDDVAPSDEGQCTHFPTYVNWGAGLISFPIAETEIPLTKATQGRKGLNQFTVQGVVPQVRSRQREAVRQLVTLYPPKNCTQVLLASPFHICSSHLYSPGLWPRGIVRINHRVSSAVLLSAALKTPMTGGAR